VKADTPAPNFGVGVCCVTAGAKSQTGLRGSAMAAAGVLRQ